MGWYEENIELNSDFYIGEKKKMLDKIMAEFYEGLKSTKSLIIAKYYGRMELYKDLGYLHPSTFVYIEQDYTARLQFVRALVEEKKIKEEQRVKAEKVTNTRVTTVVEKVQPAKVFVHSNNVARTIEFVIPLTIIEKDI